MSPHNKMPYLATIVIECRLCHKRVDTKVTAHNFDVHIKSGKMIQDSFPDMDKGIREMFISRTCDECWNKIFPLEEA